MGFILSNMMANFFGLGNAATPLGIKSDGTIERVKWGKGFGEPFYGDVSCVKYISDYFNSYYCHFDSNDV